MTTPIHALEYLGQSLRPPGVCVVFGEEIFLKRLIVRRLRETVLEADEDQPFLSLDGDATDWRDVADELTMVSLFGDGRRLVIVEDADRFVSKCRTELEDYVANPSPTSTLILLVQKWASNTRLYRLFLEKGLSIECRVPDRAVGRRKETDISAIGSWLVKRTKEHHQAHLTKPACGLLLELVGFDFGLLDQELAKLALFAGFGGEISPEMVTDVVGGWRTKTTWEMLDSATQGDADEALRQLDRLLYSGESVQAIFGAFSWSLRRFADATRIVENMERKRERVNLRAALEKAGFRKWPRGALEAAERQLRQIGRQRAGQLYQWLLEADLALKGSHSAPERSRLVVERLIVRLAQAA